MASQLASIVPFDVRLYVSCLQKPAVRALFLPDGLRISASVITDMLRLGLGPTTTQDPAFVVRVSELGKELCELSRSTEQ